MLGQRLVVAYQPEGRVAAGPVLPEHAELVAVDLVVAGPGPEPVRGVLGVEELVEEFKINAGAETTAAAPAEEIVVLFLVVLTVAELEADRGQGRQRGRQTQVIEVDTHGPQG